MCAASILRRKVWGTVAVAALVAVAGAAVLAALAGARRTDSAYERLLSATKAPDVTVVPQGFGSVDVDAIASLPGVEEVAGFGGTELVTRRGDARSPLEGEWESHTGIVPTDRRAFGDIDRVRVIEGRLPDPSRAREVAVNEAFVEQTGLGVGDRYRAWTFDFERLGEIFAAMDGDAGAVGDADLEGVFEPVDLRIVGIGRARTDIFLGEGERESAVLLTPAFGARSPHESPFGGALVRLRDGSSGVARFQRTAATEALDQSLSITSTRSAERTFDRAVSPYGDALRLFAVIAAVTGLLVVGQALARLVVSDAADSETLAAVGMTRIARVGVAACRAALSVVGGAGLAVGVAALVSPVFPLGPARAAEPDPGLQVDGPVLGLGVLALLGIMLVPVLVGAWRAGRMRTGPALALWRPSRLAERLASAGAPPSAVNGVRFALQQDRTADGSSVGTTLVGLVVAIATIGASMTFAANLDRVVATPERYGWTWDLLVDTFDSGIGDELAATLEPDGEVAGLVRGTRSTILLDGRTTFAYGLTPVRGDTSPLVVDGRMPAGPDEVALGTQTLADLGTSIGQRVRARASNGEPVELEIVGRTVVPSMTIGDPVGLGEHALLTARGLERIDPVAAPSFYLVDLRPRVSPAAFAARIPEEAGSTIAVQRPADIQTYARLGRTPIALASLLALLGTGVLAHVLVMSVRSRRRDLAILKTIGCGRRQVGATVAWQATTLVGIASLIGIPFALVLGRLTWLRLADELGVDDDVLVPAGALALLVVGAFLLANLIALAPARRAARLRPAAVLRSE